MVLVATTYLELTHPPAGDPLVAPSGEVTVAVERPAYDEYMRLWRSVGDPLDWDGRLITPAEEVEASLASPNVEIFVARFRGEAAGLCEFIKSEPLGSEIVYFGLSPAFQGRRLGPYLLDVALRQHWKANSPHRVWLHTDTWDDPRALPLYKRAGFHVFVTLDLPETTMEEEYRAAVRNLPKPSLVSE
jgi:ribosomal protein S18 acetylase RimI-like enzyme